MVAATTRTPWRKVHNIEACNCSNGCGCQFNGFLTMAIVNICHEVIEGHYGEVNLAGVRAVFAGKWPKAIHEGNGKGVLFISMPARAGPEPGYHFVWTGRWYAVGSAWGHSLRLRGPYSSQSR